MNLFIVAIDCLDKADQFNLHSFLDYRKGCIFFLRPRSQYSHPEHALVLVNACKSDFPISLDYVGKIESKEHLIDILSMSMKGA